MAYCGKCFHLDVCKTADSCDGERPDRRRGRIEGRERVAAVGKEQACFDGRSSCRAPQQDHVPRCRHFADKTAISQALGKQESKKPIRESLADRSCPVCEAYITFDALNENIEDAPYYCKHCGQALEWEE